MDATTQLGLIALMIIIVLIFAVTFTWAHRQGGNMRHPFIATQYLIEARYHRLRDERRRHLQSRKVPAAPEAVSPLNTAEDAFFFLHEIELETQQELTFNDAGEVEVTPKQFKRLTNYFHIATKASSPQEAFTHYGLTLRVVKAAKPKHAPESAKKI